MVVFSIGIGLVWDKCLGFIMAGVRDKARVGSILGMGGVVRIWGRVTDVSG